MSGIRNRGSGTGTYLILGAIWRAEWQPTTAKSANDGQDRQRPPTTANDRQDRQDRQRRTGRVSPNLWRSWRFSSAKDCLPMTCENCLSANRLADLADLDLF